MSEWDSKYRGITEVEWNKLCNHPVGVRFTPEVRAIWDKLMAEYTKVCICEHTKMDHSEDEGVEHYCSNFFCTCRNFIHNQEV